LDFEELVEGNPALLVDEDFFQLLEKVNEDGDRNMSQESMATVDGGGKENYET
jgi:hypothetical protein